MKHYDTGGSVRRRLRLGVGLGLGLGSLAGCLGGPTPPPPLNPVRLLLIGDFTPTAADSGSLARVATVRRRIADQGPLIFVAAGNVLRHASVAALNAAGLRYATFGSAELTLPADSLKAAVAASTFTWLSSNCNIGGASGERLTKVAEWDTLRISTHKIGIFGLTEPGTYSADAASSIRCTDADSAARRVVDTLVAQGVELIVALTSQPTSDDRDLLLREPRVQLVLGGNDPDPATVALAERYLLKAGTGAQHAQFVTVWQRHKEGWRQAPTVVPIDGRLPPDSAVARVLASPGNKNPD